MKIQYISDIHLETLYPKDLKNFTPIEDVDVLCICGDLGYPSSLSYKNFLIQCSKYWKKVFLIVGNHEYYNKYTFEMLSIDQNKEYIKNIIKDNNLFNITFLDNSYEDYNGYRFVGSTLWSKLPENPEKKINDFDYIKDMTMELYNKLHSDSVKFIEEIIEDSKDLPIIMLTHHLPSYTLIDEKYLSSESEAYNIYFASELDHLIKSPIKLWLCGHTHTGFDKVINEVKICCNPGGYPYENVGKNLNKFVKL